MISFLKKIFGPLYLVLIGIFCVRYVSNNVDDLVLGLKTFDYLFLPVAAICTFLYYINFCFAYKIVQSSFNREANIRLTQVQWAKAFIIGYIGRYLPGKLAILLGRMHYLARFGFSKVSILIGTLCENILVVIVALFLSVPMLFWLDVPINRTVNILIAVFLLGICVLFLFSSYFKKVINFVLNKQLPHLAGHIKEIAIDRKVVAKASILMFFSIFFMGLAFFFICKGFKSEQVILDIKTAYFFSAAYVFAGVVGLLAIFAPSGIGVREGVVCLLLSNSFDKYSAETILIAAVGMRFLLMIFEMFGFLCIWLAEINLSSHR